MVTLGSLVNEITNIMKAVDLIEVKGHGNAAYVTYIYDKCNHLINEINEAAREIEEKAREEQKENESVGEANG